MWWEYNNTYNGSVSYHYVNCPVCRATLGKKDKEDSVSFHCMECKAVFTFYPGIEKPTARLDSNIAETCKCPSCRANRGELDDEEETPKRVWLPSENEE